MMRAALLNERIGLLSDVHGNRWALEGVLADAARRGVHRFLNLGDSVYGPLDPAGTARLLMALDAPTVCGNEDRLVVRAVEHPSRGPTLRYVRENLPAACLTWLASLPPTCTVGEEIFLCHGTPRSDEEYLLHRVDPVGAVPRSGAEVAALLTSVTAPLVLCGHDHLPDMRHLPDGRLVVNPGSVGLPAYQDDFPYAHTMAAGSPHARYAILTRHAAGWDVELLTVTYDWGAAATQASMNGRPDWAGWLRTGRAVDPS
jgi:diadenosine tetraphosphatase ApaH/serine/threonine PP2A family protein phosphatase